ncbi:hypothetical protein K469DRAFT_222599 [Zopfia rhizophila CBS 207.26]|uniref:Uncharacterized protein n=1 Tax=Zopfia rhizophila CBS 207.26 TaxID=1314779 RepID=A0A6A6DUP0_9PEZI|nr:hypothetical protein K469DRAFT_222599 [Zopfia rhizophila CBS 207.26]
MYRSHPRNTSPRMPKRKQENRHNNRRKHQAPKYTSCVPKSPSSPCAVSESLKHTRKYTGITGTIKAAQNGL